MPLFILFISEYQAPSRQDAPRPSFEDSSAPLLNTDAEAQYEVNGARGANLK